MNNYCTNCGNRLNPKELQCEKCNTPIVKLPDNYNYISPQQKEKRKKIKKICIIIIISIASMIGIIFIINALKIYNLKKNYVKPYLKENYNISEYSIKYDGFGKCIISGDCYFDPVFGCDGGTCQQYKYLDEKKCKSYYFKVKNNKNEEFIITVFHKDKIYSTVTGKNINGSEGKNIDDFSDESIIDEYSFESEYYTFGSSTKDKKISK